MQAIDVLKGETRGPDYLRINPRGQVPYLAMTDGKGIGESNAIAWFFAQGSSLMPSDPVSCAQVVQWMLFEQTQLEPNIAPARFFTHIVPALKKEHLADIPRWLDAGHRALGILDSHLSTRDFITDHGYSVGDIAVFGYTHLAAQGGFDLDRFPAVVSWIQRVKATAGYVDIKALLPE
ncbi:MAG: Disulfide-bond oxidoreductase YfcG [Pseudomonadota bacterium]